MASKIGLLFDSPTNSTFGSNVIIGICVLVLVVLLILLKSNLNDELDVVLFNKLVLSFNVLFLGIGVTVLSCSVIKFAK